MVWENNIGAMRVVDRMGGDEREEGNEGDEEL